MVRYDENMNSATRQPSVNLAIAAACELFQKAERQAGHSRMAMFDY